MVEHKDQWQTDVPASISFGTTILTVPTFAEMGLPESSVRFGLFETTVQPGDWVNRGDTLVRATYHYFLSDKASRLPWKTDRTGEVPSTLSSPVSGMVIARREVEVMYEGDARATSSGLPFSYGRRDILPVILLPKDEPPPYDYELSFYRYLKGILWQNPWPRLLYSHGQRGYVRLGEAIQDFSTERRAEVLADFEELENWTPRLENFQLSDFCESDSGTVRFIQRLRSYNLMLRDKLVHLVSDGD